MKQLLAGIVLLIIVGVVGFIYRNEMEHRFQTPNVGTGMPGAQGGQACTDEAKVCPDGSAVGRTGPNCSFAPCALPNVEIPVASSTIGFVLPSGYSADENALGAEPTLIAAFVKPSSTQSPNTIMIREYSTPAGETGEQVMLAHTTLNPSGMQATSTKQFSTIVIRGRTFYAITIERFEGQVDTAYYLLRTNDVLRFEVVEKDVTSWTDPKLNIGTLPEHQSLLQMLGTLQIS